MVGRFFGTFVTGGPGAPGGNRTVLAVFGLAALSLVVALALNLVWLGWLAVIVGAIGGVTLLSLQRYSSIRVTRNELAGGRDRLAITSLEPGYGVRRGEDALPDEVRASLEVGISAKRADLRWPRC